MNFALIGAAGYIAPRHMRAIADTGNKLLISFDPNDSVGIMDSFFPDSSFHNEFEMFYEEANQLRGQLDFLTVCSPNYLHVVHCALGLRLGVDVICEKPLAPSVEQIDELITLEKLTGKRVFNILQLRLHDSVTDLRETILLANSAVKYDVELTYITSRGRWYDRSWKGDPRKSFSVIANIGIHFFDMLTFIFGPVEKNNLHYLGDNKASGYMELQHARVKWFLSIDRDDLPASVPHGQTTFRSIDINGKQLEFSKGFTDLHTKSYQHIMDGKGFGLNDVRTSTEVVEQLLSGERVNECIEKRHPLAGNL